MHTYIAGRIFPFDLYVLSWQLDRWNKTSQMVKKGQLYLGQTFMADLSFPLITRKQSQTFVGQRIE